LLDHNHAAALDHAEQQHDQNRRHHREFNDGGPFSVSISFSNCWMASHGGSAFVS
jgi:hypothetical protein